MTGVVRSETVRGEEREEWSWKGKMVFLNEDKIRISYKKEGKMLFSQLQLVYKGR